MLPDTPVVVVVDDAAAAALDETATPMLGAVELEYGRPVVSDVLGMGTAA